jgi:hypothetical protein
MHLSTANILSLVFLAIGAPTSEPNNPIAYNRFEKRHPDRGNCALDNYPKIGQRATLEDIGIWQGYGESYNVLSPEIVVGTQGWCTLSWCGGKGDMTVGFYLCLNADAIKDAYDPRVLANQIEAVYIDCNLHDPTDKTKLAYALQYWGDKYNILVAENATCSDLGNTVFHTNG